MHKVERHLHIISQLCFTVSCSNDTDTTTPYIRGEMGICIDDDSNSVIAWSQRSKMWSDNLYELISLLALWFSKFSLMTWICLTQMWLRVRAYILYSKLLPASLDSNLSPLETHHPEIKNFQVKVWYWPRFEHVSHMVSVIADLLPDLLHTSSYASSPVEFLHDSVITSRYHIHYIEIALIVQSPCYWVQTSSKRLSQRSQ